MATTGCSDSLAFVPPPSVCCGWRYHLRIRLFAPDRVGAPHPGQGCLGRGFPNHGSRWKRQGHPGSWGTPCGHALLSDPDGTSEPGQFAALGCSLPFVRKRRLPRYENLSKLHHTAYPLAVYASQGGSPHHHARLASGCWPALPGGSGYPLGPIARFQVAMSSILLTQALPGAPYEFFP